MCARNAKTLLAAYAAVMGFHEPKTIAARAPLPQGADHKAVRYLVGGPPSGRWMSVVALAQSLLVE